MRGHVLSPQPVIPAIIQYLAIWVCSALPSLLITAQCWLLPSHKHGLCPCPRTQPVQCYAPNQCSATHPTCAVPCTSLNPHSVLCPSALPWCRRLLLSNADAKVVVIVPTVTLTRQQYAQFVKNGSDFGDRRRWSIEHFSGEQPLAANEWVDALK